MYRRPVIQMPRFIDLVYADGQMLISIERALDSHLGLRLRAGEARQRLGVRLKRIGPVRQEAGKAEFRLPRSDTATRRMEAAIPDLDAMLGAIAARPLTPRVARQAPGTTGQERLRWTKDGRLQSSV